MRISPKWIIIISLLLASGVGYSDPDDDDTSIHQFREDHFAVGNSVHEYGHYYETGGIEYYEAVAVNPDGDVVEVARYDAGGNWLGSGFGGGETFEHWVWANDLCETFIVCANGTYSTDPY